VSGKEKKFHRKSQLKHNSPKTPKRIHGGGYQVGGFGGEGQNGNYLACNYDMPVVVVTLQYRLSALGFMAHEILRNRTTDSSVGNYGALDQRYALQWVQKNIAYFGGDPNRVTIHGNSAGGFSTSFHMVAPGSQGLFQRAMSSSGALGPIQAQTLQTTTPIAEFVFDAIGCNITKLGPNAAIKCATQVDAHTLITQAAKPYDLNIWQVNIVLLKYCPVIDGVTLKDHPYNLAKQGGMTKVPILIGAMMDDGSIYSAPLPMRADDDDLRNFFNLTFGPYGNDVPPALFSLYHNITSCTTQTNTSWCGGERCVGDQM